MNRDKQIEFLNRILLEEMPQYRSFADSFAQDRTSRRRLLRSLMNLRPPAPLRADFLKAQDALLQEEREEKGVVDSKTLPVTAAEPRFVLWQGDITRLRAGAVVNAANSALLGCFHPCHGCIDNAIHSAAGLELREACAKIMRAQGHKEPVGQAKLTRGYNLPAQFVLHTVGPVVHGILDGKRREELSSCYRACLSLAAKRQIKSLAFCCISTGEFHFPNREAAEIAVQTAMDFLRSDSTIQKVIFNVYKDLDAEIYRKLLGPDRPSLS